MTVSTTRLRRSNLVFHPDAFQLIVELNGEWRVRFGEGPWQWGWTCRKCKQSWSAEEKVQDGMTCPDCGSVKGASAKVESLGFK